MFKRQKGKKMKQYFCLGTYTEPILFGTGEVFYGKGKGVYILYFEDGKIDRVSELEVRNPSFLTVDDSRRKIYAVNELKEYRDEPGGGVTEISYDYEGNMKEDFTTSTGGKDPCHIIVSPDKSFLSVANFASGSVTVFGLNEEGKIAGKRKTFQHEGRSIHPKRQLGPHAHSSVFSLDGKYMFVPDLGLDIVKAYRVVKGGIFPSPEKDVHVVPGNGPRFGEFRGNGRDFYLINEIGSKVEHYIYEDGNFDLKDSISTLPEGFAGDNICSDLHLSPDGNLLFASNRGHDSIVVCRIGYEGEMKILHIIPCGGKTPRNFAVDPTGKYLLVGNQDSNTIVTFQIEADGTLQKVSTYDIGSPVCIRFFTKTSFGR